MSDGDFSAMLTRAGLDSELSPWREVVVLFERESADRPTFLHDVAQRVARPEHATALIRALASESDIESRRLSLELAALTPALDPVLIPWLRPMLRDRRMPRRVLLGAAKALVAAAGRRGGTTARVLRDFAAGFGRLRVLHFRAALRRHFAGVAAFDRLCDRLKVVMPLRCPRCGVRRKPQSMVRHLWHRHRRLLLGRRVRTPSGWLDDWSLRQPAPADPFEGLAELSQLLIRRELNDLHAETDLQFAAQQKKSLVCPHCQALVHRPADRDFGEPPAPLELSDHRLTGEDVVVGRTARGIRATISITDAYGNRETVPDPRGPWRTAPAVRRLVVPWILIAIAAAAALPEHWAVLGAGVALSMACGFRILVRMRAAPEAGGSLIDSAWRWCERGRVDARYRARLALTSRERGRAGVRTRLLEQSLNETASGPIAEWTCLAALRVCDAEAIGDDPVRILADLIGAQLRGHRFAVVVERVLALIPWRDWPLGRRRRLRAAVAERCFEYGLGVRELSELGRALPEFGAILDARNASNLAMLRHLWNLRPGQPWPGPRPAATVFDLAQYSDTGDDILERAPDALLSMPLPGWGPHGQLTPLIVIENGLVFRDVRVSTPAVIEVHLRRYGRGYDLHFGSHEFYYDRDPSPLAAQMSAWSIFAARALSAEAVTVADEIDGRRLERLLGSVTYPCASCGGLLRERL